ncbi:hypothetical protein BDW75DRAFT_212906 [Aspergillus navahoensis]
MIGSTKTYLGASHSPIYLNIRTGLEANLQNPFPIKNEPRPHIQPQYVYSFLPMHHEGCKIYCFLSQQ